MYQTRWSSGRSLHRLIPFFVFAFSLSFLKLLIFSSLSPSPAFAQSHPVDQVNQNDGNHSESELESAPQVEPQPTVAPPVEPTMSSQPVLDPLNSPYPVPWN
ncbi:hypothetical protein C7B61_02995 [filamentous cyanobacterium CCP1]|nr:hypothetical protein C7B61_02995 [filamentous cyanobacterium CCP1]